MGHLDLKTPKVGVESSSRGILSFLRSFELIYKVLYVETSYQISINGLENVNRTLELKLSHTMCTATSGPPW